MTAMLVLLCLSAFSFNASAFSTRAADITLPAGTRIDLELISTINSASVQAGESVDFKVRADVLVDNNVVVRAGTIAKGTVVAANRAKGIRTPGWILYKEYGNGRKYVESLVPMKVTAVAAGDLGVTGNTEIEDTTVADA